MDKDKKQIKDSFDDFLDDVNPPNLWESIGGELEEHQAQTDGELMEQSFMEFYDQEPSEKVWDAVQEELNYDLVWWRMKPVLNRMRSRYFWGKRLRLGLSFLAIYFFTHTCVYIGDADLNTEKKLVGLNEQLSNENTFSEETKNANEIYTAAEDHPQTLEQQTVSDKNVVEIPNEKGSYQQQAKNEGVINKHSVIEDREIAEIDQNILLVAKEEDEKATLESENAFEEEFDQLNFIASLYPDAIAMNMEEELTADVFEEREEEASTKASMFEFGGIATMGSTLFLNYETERALRPESIQETALMLSYSAGLSLHYLLDPKNQIGAEFYFFEHSAQRYFDYSRTGNYLNRAISMNYGKLNAFYQRNLLVNHQTKVSLKAGLYGAFLYEEEESINRYTNLNHTQFYKRFDLGGNLAVGQSYTIGQLVLDYGLFSEISFLNVFNGDNREPAHFKRTRILDFGTYVSLRYRL
jgi:hypothetical protein